VLMTGPTKRLHCTGVYGAVLDQDFNAKEKKKVLKVSGALGTVSSQPSLS